MKITIRLLSLFALLAILIVSVVVYLPLPESLGKIDFRPYWSASYLFARGLDFGDLAALDEIERRLTDWSEEYTMQAWFTPIGHLLLAPLTFLPFHQAAKVWLMLNISILALSALLLGKYPYPKTWLPLLATFSFSATLTSLFFGQVNTLSLLGLALFFHFRQKQKDLAAGASLLLTLVKPHLVFLTLPALLLSLMQQKRWRAYGGLILSSGLTGFALFVIHRNWLSSFITVLQGGLGSTRLSPSLAGVLIFVGKEILGRWLWLLGLALLFVLWQKIKQLDERTLCDVTLLIGLALSPFGWSYDQIMVLLPVLTMVGWIQQGLLPKRGKWLLAASLLLINALTYYQRLVVQNDLWFFWVPLAVLGVYLLGDRSVSRNRCALDSSQSSLKPL